MPPSSRELAEIFAQVGDLLQESSALQDGGTPTPMDQSRIADIQAEISTLQYQVAEHLIALRLLTREP